MVFVKILARAVLKICFKKC